MRRLVALGLVGCLAFLASVASAAPAKEPRKVIEPAVQGRARRIAVQLGDLPGTGWKAEPATKDTSSPRCSYYDPDQSRLTENGDYSSPDFTRADGSHVSSVVGIFVSARQARAGYEAVVRPQLPRCLSQIVVKSGAPGEILVNAAGPISLGRYGDRSAAFRISFSVRSGTARIPVVIDIVALNKASVDAALFFEAVGATPARSLEQKVLGAVVGRIASA